MLCPCGSQTDYSLCCQPLHLGVAHAETPKQLMASRYCAFVMDQADYLLATHHPDFRGDLTREELSESAQTTAWHCLQIVDATVTGDVGEVEFKAWYREDKRLQALHERSRFSREDGLWYYRDGEIQPSPTLPGRNDACLCGSGKKFKRCCG
ncbi:YchJ family protein [Ferrimonas senticii]|uniref:YchJ family protein n=1 Tax=Ferrimonas senticii TaxID=394566 RepID=UPI0003F998C4|nr:YchJ family protein [Ferrimonas senticii]